MCWAATTMPTAVTHCAMGHACVETRTENMDQANCEALDLWDSSHYLQQPPATAASSDHGSLRVKPCRAQHLIRNKMTAPRLGLQRDDSLHPACHLPSTMVSERGPRYRTQAGDDTIRDCSVARNCPPEGHRQVTVRSCHVSRCSRQQFTTIPPLLHNHTAQRCCVALLA